MVVDLLGRGMKRVLVVGAGIHGLVKQSRNICLKPSFRIGKEEANCGRGTSQSLTDIKSNTYTLLLKGGNFIKC